MKVAMSAETYQVGAHFKALIKAILVAKPRILENFFLISCLPAAMCAEVTGVGIQILSGRALF